MYCPNCKINTTLELDFYYGSRFKSMPLNFSNEKGDIEGTDFVEVQYEYCPRCGHYEILPSSGTIDDLARQNKMIPLKKKYGDENELIAEFCNRTQCKVCFGSDDTGEANGYGCEVMEDFIDNNYHLIKK